MNAQGLFFLSARPYIVNTRNGENVTRKEWRFSLIERDGGKGTDELVAYWPSVEAAAFVQGNPGLKAGDALQLEFSRVRARKDVRGEPVLFCRIMSAQRAPVRWPKTEVDPTAAPATTPATTTAPA